MAKKCSTRLLQEALNLVTKYKTAYSAATAIGDRIPQSTIMNRFRTAKAVGLKPTVEPQKEKPAYGGVDHRDVIKNALKKSPQTLEDLSPLVDIPKNSCYAVIQDLKKTGYNISEHSGVFSIEKTPAPAFTSGDLQVYESRDDNTFLFGACGDKHLGSKYHRADVLKELYEEYEAQGVDRVYDMGNWIDGEARFNKYDLLVHGMDSQMKYLVDNHPHKKGITTYAISGDDHEGWYAQREGIDVGHYLETLMKSSGRDDWVDMGYMEAHVRLVNKNTGVESVMTIAHPGGGSSYAISYSIQKIIESLDGGEKPAVGLYGHYHKLWSGNIRNVWVAQSGTCQDQTPFARKKKLDFHLGGMVIKLKQDPETGAIIRMTVEMLRFFNKGYYNNRWSHSGNITLPKRGL